MKQLLTLVSITGIATIIIIKKLINLLKKDTDVIKDNGRIFK